MKKEDFVKKMEESLDGMLKAIKLSDIEKEYYEPAIRSAFKTGYICAYQDILDEYAIKEEL